MQYKTGNICRYNDNSGNHIVRKPVMICMDTVHLANKKMQKESIIIKEIRPNINVLQGPEVKVYPHSESNSFLVEIIENSKNVKASIFIFTLTGTLLQMIQVKDARTVVHIPSLENGKYLMNIQIGRDVSTWKITKE